MELAAFVAAARRARPTLVVDEVAFAAHVHASLAAGANVGHAADLLLAFACGSGDEAALGILERELIAPLASTVLRGSIAIDEVLQVLRVTLIVGTARGGPRILQYRGRGPLAAWLAICATRLMIHQRGTPTLELDDTVAEPLATSGALAYLQGRYRDVFNRAFQAAMKQLTPRDRALLHQYYALGTGMERLGVVYGVSRATAARRVALARARLVATVRDRVAGELQIDPAEADSILRSIRSAIELSLPSAG